MRKKQVDMDIRQRVGRLLNEYGPESGQPLTLRIYGTMIKGFCMINNERARTLYCDCERVVLMFARQPTSDGDNTIRLPASKRPRMEASLTLDIDLAKLDNSGAFDWTQAPLEQGALLGVCGGQHLQEALPSFLEMAGADKIMGAVPMLDPTVHTDPAFAGPMVPTSDVGWLPRFDDAAPAPVNQVPGDAEQPQSMQKPAHDPNSEKPPSMMEQLMPLEAASTRDQASNDQLQTRTANAPPSCAGGVVTARLRRELLLKPGVVHGFDADPMMPSTMYDQWQKGDGDLLYSCHRPSEYAEMLSLEMLEPDHLAPDLRVVLDPIIDAFLQPVHGLLQPLKVDHPTVAEIPAPAVLHTTASKADHMGAPAHEPATESRIENISTLPGEAPMAQSQCSDIVLHHAALQPTPQELMATELVPPVVIEPPPAVTCGQLGGVAAEAQDDRTHEVGNIIRGCLQSNGATTAAFHEFVPPGIVDRATAACTFAAILALTSAGEFTIKQAEPYGCITISVPQ